MITSETKNCLSCGKLLKGRVDKKFCDDYCRNNYNNQLKARSSHSAYVRSINNTLLKNRKILESVLPGNEETAKPAKTNCSGSIFILNTSPIFIPLKQARPIFTAMTMATCHWIMTGI